VPENDAGGENGIELSVNERDTKKLTKCLNWPVYKMLRQARSMNIRQTAIAASR
jgi:hypothetical protein